MENISPIRAQIVSIVASLCFLAYIAYLIVRNRLRIEYSIIWIISSLVLIIFSLWRQGLEVLAGLLGIYAGLNLAFAVAIFAIIIYLLHLSIVASKLQEQNKTLAQQMAFLKEEIKKARK